MFCLCLNKKLNFWTDDADDVEKEAKKNNLSWVAEINFCRLSPPPLSFTPNDRNLYPNIVPPELSLNRFLTGVVIYRQLANFFSHAAQKALKRHQQTSLRSHSLDTHERQNVSIL